MKAYYISFDVLHFNVTKPMIAMKDRHYIQRQSDVEFTLLISA